MFKELFLEALKIKKKAWNIDVPGWKVQMNDKVQHSLLDRVKDRTDLSMNEMKEKIQKGVSYVTKKIKRPGRTMVALNFKKSNFILMILIDNDKNFARVSTILDPNMKVSNALKWDISETEDFKNSIDFELSIDL